MNWSFYSAAAMCFIGTSVLAAEFTWPEPSLPPSTQLASLGDDLSINGIPTRIFTFTTRASTEQVVAEFKQQIDSELTEVAKRYTAQGAQSLGGRHGRFWLTLKVQETKEGASGTWAATPRFIPNAKQTVVIPPGFPASAKLVQQIDSYDAGKRSQMAIGLDPSPVDGVARRMEEQLRESGFVKQALPRSNWPAPDRYVAVFAKAREELWVTLQQDRAGTSVTINRLSALESLQ